MDRRQGKSAPDTVTLRGGHRTRPITFFFPRVLVKHPFKNSLIFFLAAFFSLAAGAADPDAGADGKASGRRGRKKLPVLYYFNPTCRSCDAATALVKTMERQYAPRITVHYRNLNDADKKTREKNLTEFVVYLDQYKRTDTPTLVVVVGQEALLADKDEIVGKLPALLEAKFGPPSEAGASPAKAPPGENKGEGGDKGDNKGGDANVPTPAALPPPQDPAPKDTAANGQETPPTPEATPEDGAGKTDDTVDSEGDAEGTEGGQVVPLTPPAEAGENAQDDGDAPDEKKKPD